MRKIYSLIYKHSGKSNIYTFFDKKEKKMLNYIIDDSTINECRIRAEFAPAGLGFNVCIRMTLCLYGCSLYTNTREFSLTVFPLNKFYIR